MITQTPVVPQWYLRAAAPVGDRYFYPVPASKAPYSGAHGEGYHWTDEIGNPLTVSGSALVSDRLIIDAVEHWQEGAHVVGWEIKNADDVPAHLVPLLSAPFNPATMTPQEMTERTQNAKRARAQAMAMPWHAEVTVARRIIAPTKVAAVAELRTIIDGYLEILLPPHTTACSRCNGLGFTS